VQLGNETGVFQDASESSGMRTVPAAAGTTPGMGATAPGAVTSGRTIPGENPYMNCDLRAKLAGYRSQNVNLANLRPMEDPNIGTILLHREGADEGTTVSATSLAAPKDARKAFAKGELARKKNKIDVAADDYAKAAQLYPAFAEAWFELGRIQMGRTQTADARHSFEQAVKGDPKFVNPYVELSILELEARRWPELAATSDHAIRLDPFDYPQLYLFNSAANYNQQQFDAAEKSIREALRLDTRHTYPDIERLMGLVLVQKRDYPAAAEHLRAFVKLAPDSEETPAVEKKIAQLEGAMAANKQ